MAECAYTKVPSDACYIEFVTEHNRIQLIESQRTVGKTVRGEDVIADIDADGNIIGFELVDSTVKTCQMEEKIAGASTDGPSN